MSKNLKKSNVTCYFFGEGEILIFQSTLLNSIFNFYLSNLRNFDIQNDIILYIQNFENFGRKLKENLNLSSFHC